MADESESTVEQYDPNPYDDLTLEEALKQLFNRFTPRTVRQAIFTMAESGGGKVYEQLEAGANITIEETSDGKAKISASGEISSEDTYARAEIADIKDGETLDSFGDVETALGAKVSVKTDTSEETIIFYTGKE